MSEAYLKLNMIDMLSSVVHIQRVLAQFSRREQDAIGDSVSVVDKFVDVLQADGVRTRGNHADRCMRLLLLVINRMDVSQTGWKVLGDLREWWTFWKIENQSVTDNN